MSTISYAQNFEDVLLWRALRDVEAGTYLDIGAQDPVLDSVSLAFYNAGWRGTHVEPTPYYAAKLREARPDEIVIEAAVSQSLGPLEFHEFPDTGLSTGKAEIAQRHVQTGFETRTILVATVRLDNLLERTGEVHWMKIDVEGMEADVLESWGECRVRPWVLVIEATAPSTQEPTDHQWRDTVLSRGYREAHFDGLSRYFVHEEHAELQSRFAAPPNVFDLFAVAPHHFSASMLRAEVVASEQRSKELAAEVGRLNEELLTTSRRLVCEQGERELALRHEHEKNLIEMRWRERQLADEQLRCQVRELEDSFRRAMEAVQADASDARVEVARLEERAVQLEDKLRRADAAAECADERRKELEQARATSEQMRAEAEHRSTEQANKLIQAHAEIEQLRADLTLKLERQRIALAEAGRLINGALADQPSRWQRIVNALGPARRRPAWHALASWSHPAMDEASSEQISCQRNPGVTDPSMTSPVSPQARNPYLRADSLPELLSWPDINFVRCAYVTVLGRQPDYAGEIYYMERLRRGHSKMEILWQLRRSREGSRHDPGIAGFDRALRIARWERTALIGWLVRLVTRGEGDGPGWRRHRMLANAIERIDLAPLVSDLHDLRAQVQQLTNHLASNTEPGIWVANSNDAELLDTATYRRLAASTQRVFRKIIAA
jgi:FkbM family methyltransferase